MVPVPQENSELSQREVSETSVGQNHDPLHQTRGPDVNLVQTNDPLHQPEGPEVIPTVFSDIVHQLYIAGVSQGLNCGPSTHTEVMVDSVMSQDQAGLIEQVQKVIDTQYLQNMDSQMLTRMKRAMLVRKELEKTNGFFDPG